jgi:hypothetical protein
VLVAGMVFGWWHGLRQIHACRIGIHEASYSVRAAAADAGRRGGCAGSVVAGHALYRPGSR